MATLAVELALKLVEEEGRGVEERGPKVVNLDTWEAGPYTMSPVWVAIIVHSPPTAVEFKYPLLKVPGKGTSVYVQAPVEAEERVMETGRPLEELQVTGTPRRLKYPQ